MLGNTIVHRMTRTSFENLDKGVMLIKQQNLFNTQLAFWFKGSYGNFIIGTPKPTDELIAKIKELGGVFRIIPWDSFFGSDQLTMFNRFGAYYITSEKEAQNEQLVPVLSWKESPIVGVKIKKFSSSTGKNLFSFEWNNKTYTNIPEEKLASDYFLSDKQTILESVPEILGDREAGKLNELLHTDGKKMVRVAHNAHRLVILFDDIEFERNDYEVLSPKQRKQLITHLEKIGFKHKTGNKLEHSISKQEVYLSKPPKALGSPIVDSYTTTSNGVNVVTATQGAFIILNASERSAEQRAREIKTLISNIPFNVKKIKMLKVPNGFSKAEWDRLMIELEAMQKEVVQYYRTNRVNGIIGRPKIKKPLTIDAISLV